LINQGKNVLEGSVKDVKNQFKENLFQIEYQGKLPEDLGRKFRFVSNSDNKLIVKLSSEKDSNNLLMNLLQEEVQVNSFHEILPSLNEIFIKQVETSHE